MEQVMVYGGGAGGGKSIAQKLALNARVGAHATPVEETLYSADEHKAICGRLAEPDDPFEHLTGLDKLSAQLGVGQVPMRNKQGVFKPKRMALLVASALRIAPLPMLVVQFNNKGEKTTFPQYA
jgi:hypothetical protein